MQMAYRVKQYFLREAQIKGYESGQEKLSDWQIREDLPFQMAGKLFCAGLQGDLNIWAERKEHIGKQWDGYQEEQFLHYNYVVSAQQNWKDLSKANRRWYSILRLYVSLDFAPQVICTGYLSVGRALSAWSFIGFIHQSCVGLIERGLAQMRCSVRKP